MLRSLGLAQQYKYDGRLQDAEEYYNRTLAALDRVPIRTLESCCRKRWMNWAIFIIPRAGL